MNRRDFLKSSTAVLALGSQPWRADALAKAGRFDVSATAAAPKRVGLIGTGWYGKADLFRLMQVAPVEVVSLCDVDRGCWPTPPTQVAARQLSKKTPRTYSDYREMLKEKDLDIVLIATPDHWHALPMIEAVEAGADVYVQKPISVDIAEGQAMLAAARKHQARRAGRHAAAQHAAPHRSPRPHHRAKASSGRSAYVEIYCYYHMRATENPPDTAPPEYLDYEMWTGPAPMRPYNSLVHPRGWRAFMEYGNGIVGDMCVHMLDMVRWMLDLGMPTRVSSTGGILVDKASKANITDTQTATFDFGTCTSCGRTDPGAIRPIRSIRGARRSTARKARSRPASTATTSSRSAAVAGARGRRSTSWTSSPRTRRRRISRSTSRRRSGGT